MSHSRSLRRTECRRRRLRQKAGIRTSESRPYYSSAATQHYLPGSISTQRVSHFLQPGVAKSTLNSFIELSIEAGNLLSGNGALCTIVTPSAPRGEFDGFPGRRERPNQCRHATIESSLSTYPTLGRSRRRRTAPSDPLLNQPSGQFQAACPERPNPRRPFINLNIGLNLEPNE